MRHLKIIPSRGRPDAHINPACRDQISLTQGHWPITHHDTTATMHPSGEM
jgi:hypothetical protein